MFKLMDKKKSQFYEQVAVIKHSISTLCQPRRRARLPFSHFAICGLIQIKKIDHLETNLSNSILLRVISVSYNTFFSFVSLKSRL